MTRLFFFLLFISTLQANAASLTLPSHDTIPSSTRLDYLAKSKQNLTIAIVMASVGGVAVATGIVGMFVSGFGDLVETGNTKSYTGYYILIIMGGILALASIPVFMSAKKNRRLAKTVASIKLKMEKSNSLQSASITKSYFPAFKICIRF